MDRVSGAFIFVLAIRETPHGLVKKLDILILPSLPSYRNCHISQRYATPPQLISCNLDLETS